MFLYTFCNVATLLRNIMSSKVWSDPASLLSVVYVHAAPICRMKLRIRVSYLRVFLVVMLLRPDPSSHQMVAHGVRQCEVVVALRCNISVLNQSKMQMAIKIGLELRYVFNPGETSHGNLLPLLLVRQWLGHLVDWYIIVGFVHQEYKSTRLCDACCVCCDCFFFFGTVYGCEARHRDLQLMLQGQARSLAARTLSLSK